MLLEEALVENVISVERIDRRIMLIRIMIRRLIVRVFSVYATQSGRPVHEKDSFFSALLCQLAIIPDDELLLVCGDLNGHVGETSGFDGIHGGHGFGARNAEGIRILDFCTAANLSVVNTFLVKEESKLITLRLITSFCVGKI